MKPDPKQLVIVAVIAAVVGGLCGFLAGKPAAQKVVSFDEVKVKKLVADEISADMGIVKTLESDQIGTRNENGYSMMMKNGSLSLVNAVVASEVRSGTVLGNSLRIVADNLKTTPTAECHVTAQITSSKGGGLIYLHNREGMFVIKDGPVKKGNVIFMGYDDRGLPSLFTQNVAQGEKGKLSLIQTTVKENPKADTKDTKKTTKRRR